MSTMLTKSCINKLYVQYSPCLFHAHLWFDILWFAELCELIKINGQFKIVKFWGSLWLSLERFRFGFQYLYRYLNQSFSQSNVPDLPDWPMELFKNREKVAVVVEEVNLNLSISFLTTYDEEQSYMQL